MKKLALFFVLLSACTTLSISPARASSLPGEVFKLVASQTPVVWTASVGSIDSNGVWTAPPCSTSLPVVATITATTGGSSATSQITVEDKVTAVTVTPSAATVAPGGTVTFKATVKTVCFPAGVATVMSLKSKVAAK